MESTKKLFEEFYKRTVSSETSERSNEHYRVFQKILKFAPARNNLFLDFPSTDSAETLRSCKGKNLDKFLSDIKTAPFIWTRFY